MVLGGGWGAVSYARGTPVRGVGVACSAGSCPATCMKRVPDAAPVRVLVGGLGFAVYGLGLGFSFPFWLGAGCGVQGAGSVVSGAGLRV